MVEWLSQETPQIHCSFPHDTPSVVSWDKPMQGYNEGKCGGNALQSRGRGEMLVGGGGGGGGGGGCMSI